MSSANKIAFSPAQLSVLQQLADKGPQPRDPLMRTACIGHNTMAKVFESLEYRGLVIEGERPKGRAVCLLEITMAGRRALADLVAGIYTEPARVQPPTRNVLQGFYRPPPEPFYRNNGHKHIVSFGEARC